jgi:hypothetical protein
MIQTFVEHLRKRIKEESESVADALRTGGVKSFDEYRHMTGVIHGLTIAEREIADLMKALED